MRSAGIISAFILSVILCGNASAQSRLTPAEYIVCKNLRHCVDIINDHAPDSFDYQVLNSEFQRFGAKGKAALLKMLASKDETQMRRAQAVLAKGRTLLTPDEQHKIAALWPRGDLDMHAQIMKSALSPLMRARVIETLSHENAQVREISRDIIAATVTKNMDFPLRPDDFGRLAKALLDDPTPALVELFSTFDSAKTKPVLMRLLQSKDGPTLNAAYAKLYTQNPEEAFKTLVATLYGLKDDQAEEAFALSFMLRERHVDRKDGFYLKFAKGLTEDPEMSLMGRLAGFDAIMQSEDAPLLSEPRNFSMVMKTALQNHDTLPMGYLRNMPRQAADNSDLWLSAYWQRLQTLTHEQKLDFIRLVGGFETGGAKNILLEALSDKGDWRIIQAAALPLGRMRYEPAKNKLEELSDHPIMAVQIAALTALDGIERGDMKGRATYWMNTLFARQNYCVINPTDFLQESSNLPFFEGGQMASYSALKLTPARRKYLTSAAASLDGYLAGYSNAEFGGGLLYYDNASGVSKLVLKSQIQAIIPVRKLPLGQFPKSFWVFTQSDTSGMEDYALYKVSTDALSRPELHAALPSRPTAITQIEDSSVVMSFGTVAGVNPPLLLSPNGSIRRACPGPADSAEALP